MILTILTIITTPVGVQKNLFMPIPPPPLPVFGWLLCGAPAGFSRSASILYTKMEIKKDVIRMEVFVIRRESTMTMYS